MLATILAAGRGSRLGAATEDRPKCMVELRGRPLIQRQVAALRGGGISRIGVVRGYQAEKIDLPGVTYFQNPRWAATNMVMSLARAEAWLRSEPVLVSYGDIFYGQDVVKALACSPGDLAIAYDPNWRNLWARRFADPLSDAETFRTDAGGYLIEIGGRTTRIEDIQGQYMGLLKFTPRAWEAVETVLSGLDEKSRDALDMTSLLRRLLDSNFPIRTVRVDAQWGEIDSSGDLELYEQMIRDGELCLEN